MSQTPWPITRAEAETSLPATEVQMRVARLLRHGSMDLQFYAPRGRDTQTPHKRDELYIVVSGNGLFSLAGEGRPFQSGDAIFVPAGAEHRFEAFSDDFATWVVFWGPEGGEAANRE